MLLFVSFSRKFWVKMLPRTCSLYPIVAFFGCTESCFCWEGWDIWFAVFVVALAARAMSWTVACPPRPKICTKQPWCRSPPSGWSTIYTCVYICLYFCLGQCFHTGPDRFGQSPFVQAHPGRFPSKHKPGTKKN